MFSARRKSCAPAPHPCPCVRSPATSPVRFTLILFTAALVLTGCARLSAEDRSQLAFLLLVQARTDAFRGGATEIVCVAVRREAPDSARLERVLIDPDPAVLRRLQSRYGGIVPVSRCERGEIVNLPDGAGSMVRERSSGRTGLVVWVRELPSLANRARIGYFAHELAAGEWTCRIAKARGEWRTSSCMPEWVS